MKKIFFGFSVAFLFCSCGLRIPHHNNHFASVAIDTLLQDKISIRALVLDKKKFGMRLINLDSDASI